MHMSQLMPLPLAVSCFGKIQIGFTFLVPAHLSSPGQRAVKRVCVYVCGISDTVNSLLFKLHFSGSFQFKLQFSICFWRPLQLLE